MSTEFGKLIEAKLKERHFNQRDLARRIGCAPTTVNYLIRGRKFHSGTKAKPDARMVINVAKLLGIPVDEALSAAGHDPAIAETFAPIDKSGPPPETEPMAAAITSDDLPTFDIAYQAALKAISDKQPDDDKSGPQGVMLKFPGRMTVRLLDPAGLTDEHIRLYREVLGIAYEKVRAEIDAERKGGG